MARAAQFELSALVAVATALAARGGAASVTMQGLAAATGAPSGSVYHRFTGRPELLAEVWLGAAEQFQAAWWKAVEPEQDPGEIGAFPLRWARRNRAPATVLAVHRAEDFLSPELGAPHRARWTALRAHDRRLAVLAQRFLTSTSRVAVRRATFAFATAPLAALRRPLGTGGPITRDLEAVVRETATALMHRRMR